MNYLISSNAPHIVRTKNANLAFREFAINLNRLNYMYIKSKIDAESALAAGSISLILQVDDEQFSEDFFEQLLKLFTDKQINPIIALQSYELPDAEIATHITKSGDTFRLTYEKNDLVAFLNKKYSMLLCSFIVTASSLIALKIGTDGHNYILLSERKTLAPPCKNKYLEWSKLHSDQYNKALLFAKFARESHVKN